MEFREEKDTLGTMKVPRDSYFGAFTQRAINNFKISGITAPVVFQKALGIVKLAALKANTEIGLLTDKQSHAIQKACEEFIDGKFTKEFCLDIFQAGAGTSYNMNANEIIANRANELLGGKKGKYEYIHPNNHVNMAQSTNDVIPVAVRIAVLLMLPDFLKEIENLEKDLEKKAKTYKNSAKVGRTHLQDAVPITFGQEFDSYKEAIRKSRLFILRQSEDLKILGIGGTAVGTGINADPKYKNLAIKYLSNLTGIKFTSTKNLTETIHNMNSFMNFSAAIRSLAVDILNFSNDMKLLSMGPRAGISEISLPELQPGSSIMPGKNNPAVPESMEMVCYHILGNDKTIELAAQRSQLELNAMCPVIMYNLLQSIQLLTKGINTFTELCIKNIKVNEERAKMLIDRSLITATSLCPRIGYQKTAEIVKAALKNDTTIAEELKKRGL